MTLPTMLMLLMILKVTMIPYAQRDFQINLNVLVFADDYRCCCLVSYPKVLNLSDVFKYILVYHVLAYALYMDSRVRICI
jgi:hypothetical protein